jgi:hypothetical protein
MHASNINAGHFTYLTQRVGGPADVPTCSPLQPGQSSVAS